MGDWEEDASVATLGYIFSPGSGAATATADAEHAPSQGRNDGRPICVLSKAGGLHSVCGREGLSLADPLSLTEPLDIVCAHQEPPRHVKTNTNEPPRI